MNETVILPSKKPLIGVAMLEAVVVVVWAFIYFTLLPPASQNILYLVAPVVLFSALTTVTILRLNLTKLVIAPPQLTFESGLLTKTNRSFDLSKIQDVRIEQSLWERIFGIGTISIETASAGGAIRMERIDSPKQVANQILAAARRS